MFFTTYKQSAASFNKASFPSRHEELVIIIVKILINRAKLGYQTTFIKVKSHIGIRGNEIADKLAKHACNISTAHPEIYTIKILIF